MHWPLSPGSKPSASELRKQLLERRQQNLDVRSPIDGIVTVGDLDKVEGAPVARGQTLFEVAPLDKMTVEIAIPEDDIQYVSRGFQAGIRLDSYPDVSWQGVLSRIHPRAEIRDNRNVFVAEFTLANPDERLRPGMLGRARIIGPRRPLFWNLFHKPWQWLRFRLGF